VSRSHAHAMCATFAVALAIGVLSCTAWGPAATSARLAVQEKPGKLRVILHGGDRLVVLHPTVSGDTLFGVTRVPRLGQTWLSVPVAIPLADIDSVSVRQFDAPSTMVALTAGIALLVVAGKAAESSGGGTGCSGVDVPILGP